MPSSISVALYHPRLLVAIRSYIYVVGCYAAWSNNYSGQEEATLCIVKCLKEDRKLAFQMRNKVAIQQR